MEEGASVSRSRTVSQGAFETDCRRLNTSLFAVSRKVSAEALEVFYKGNVIRAKSLNDPYHTRPLTRHLELVGDIVKRMVLWRGSSATNAAMTARTNISELRTLSLAIDCVYDGSLPPITPSEVRSIESARLSKSHPTQMPRMVDYGVTEEVARPPSKLRVFFKRFDLIDAVAHARSLDPELSLEELDERYEEGVKQKSFRQIAVTLFALRMACLEAVRAKADLDEDQQRIVDQHLWISPHRRVEVDVLLAQAPSETRLLDLTVEKVGQDVFKRADDLVGDLLPLPPRWR